MPEPSETIAQVIGVHEAWQRPDRTWECACGKAFGLKINLDYHVADAVLAAFTQEWGASDVEEPDDPGAWMADRGWAERYAKSEGGKVFTRFVTPWVQT